MPDSLFLKSSKIFKNPTTQSTTDFVVLKRSKISIKTSIGLTRNVFLQKHWRFAKPYDLLKPKVCFAIWRTALFQNNSSQLITTKIVTAVTVDNTLALHFPKDKTVVYFFQFFASNL